MITANNIDWKNIKLVIFDVDGTLYSQSGLRWKMLFELFSHYLLRPWRYKDILILYHFRAEREKKSGYIGENLNEKQFEWCADKVKLPIYRIKNVVDKWIFNFPNKYLKRSMYPYVNLFFKMLKEKKKSIAVYSDYITEKKLKHMDLYADMQIASTDKSVNAFKPAPNGIIEILSAFKIEDKSTCLFIGDRLELDGACAKQAGIPYLIINKEQAKKNLYKLLLNNLNIKG